MGVKPLPWIAPAALLGLLPTSPGAAQNPAPSPVLSAAVNVHSLGIAGRGISDETAALQKALDTHKHLYLPSGIYEVSVPLRLPNGASLRGDGANTVLQETDPKAAQMLEIKGSGAAYAGNNEVVGIKFVGVVDQPQFAIFASKSRNVWIHHCFAENCGLIWTEAQRPYQEIASEDDLNRNLTVADNDIEGSREHPSHADGGIRLSYVADARISRNTVKYFRNGIEWWGGDSAFGKDGAIANPRWARRIRIEDNAVENSAGGGIWGSMGQNITVGGNRVSDSGDVGIDFEGCLDATAEGNIESDAPNGGLAVFFATKNVQFRRNIVTTRHAEWPLFRSYNSSLDPTFGTGHLTGMGCILEGNNFVCPHGTGVVDDHNGPNQLTFRNNTFYNVRLDISHTGNGDNSLAPTIERNVFFFDADRSEPFTAINVFSSQGHAVVRQNSLACEGSHGSNKIGIQVQTQSALSSAIDVEGNTVQGFGQADIVVYCYPGGKNTAAVTGNHAEGKTIKIGPARVVTASGNVSDDPAGAQTPVAWQSIAEAP